MNAFNYTYPVTVYFGEKAAEKNLAAELAKHGKTVLLAYGGGSIKKNGVYDELTSILKAAGKEIVEFTGVMSNPTYEKVQEGARLARERSVDFILAVGGGSVIDCCKIVSAQAKLDADIWDYEYGDRKVPTEFIPMGAVVTAFGTGAEMNNGAVITNTDKMLKSPLWGAFYDFAVLDPAYTMTMPMKQVISGSFDTLSHCMETYFGTPKEDNLSDEINETVMRSTIKNLRAQIANPDDKAVRSELLWAAAMGENGILKIGKATDFQCHMMEHQLGAYTDCNHGMGLSAMHVQYYRYIVEKGADKFARFAERVWGVDPVGKSELEVANEGIDALEAFIKEIGMPSNFRELGIPDNLPWKEIADSVTLTVGGYGHLTHADVLKIFEECR